MTKKFFYLFLMMSLAVAFPSCGDDDENNTQIDEAWKKQNEDAFNAMYTNSGYTKYEAPSKTGVVFYKQTTPGNGKRILYTSRADVYYEGRRIDNIIFDQNDWTFDNPFRVAMNSAVANYSSSNTSGYSTVIEGWTTILQYMTEGEEGEVWIPYQLAYGSTGSGTAVPGYSTLIFKLKVQKAYDRDEF